MRRDAVIELKEWLVKTAGILSKESATISFDEKRNMYYVHIPERLNDAGYICANTFATQVKAEAELFILAPRLLKSLITLEQMETKVCPTSGWQHHAPKLLDIILDKK